MKLQQVIVIAALALTLAHLGLAQVGPTEEWFPPERYSFDFTIGRPMGMGTGDFNEDGNVDLVITTVDPKASRSRVVVLLGDGAGAFSDPVVIASRERLGEMRTIVVTDLDQDGHQDIVSVFQELEDLATFTLKSSVVLLWGNGSGRFKEEDIDVDLGFFSFSNIVAVDLNSDGELDLAFPDFQSRTVKFLLGKGNRTYTGPHSFLLEAGCLPVVLDSGDFNEDGALDLVVAGIHIESQTESRRLARVLIGDGGGGFAEAAPHFLGGAVERVLNWIDIKAGDYNGDGHLDIIATTRSESEEPEALQFAWPMEEHVVILLGRGDGTFGDPEILFGTTHSFGAQLAFISSEAVGGLKVSVVTVVRGDGVCIDHVDRPGRKASGTSISVGDVESGVVADLDNDGMVEIVVVCSRIVGKQDWTLISDTRLVILKRRAL